METVYNYVLCHTNPLDRAAVGLIGLFFDDWFYPHSASLLGVVFQLWNVLWHHPSVVAVDVYCAIEQTCDPLFACTRQMSESADKLLGIFYVAARCTLFA